MKKRWDCPNGVHAGVLAPAKMRRIDVRRYCLACSEKTGVLVERTCPAKEREQAKRKETRRKKGERRADGDREKKIANARARTRRRHERENVLGLHVPSHFYRVCRQTSMVVRTLETLERPMPTVKVRRRHSGTYTTGHAYTASARVVLTVPTECTWGKLAVIVAHEVAHVCTADEEHHGPAWRNMFLAILEKVYGLKTTWPVKEGKSVPYHDAHSAFEKMIDGGLGKPLSAAL
jgi:hypothetical protein